MTPTVLNRICAYPAVISWIIGASVLIGLVVPSISAASDLRGTAFLFLAFVSAIGLGFFLGMFTCWPWVRPICSKINGAPLKIGDRVLILSRRYRGTTAEVYEIITGQGGWDLARLDLGSARRAKSTDIFELYSVVKINDSGNSKGSGVDSSSPVG
jgi:hypothetical protein